MSGLTGFIRQALGPECESYGPTRTVSDAVGRLRQERQLQQQQCGPVRTQTTTTDSTSVAYMHHKQAKGRHCWRRSRRSGGREERSPDGSSCRRHAATAKQARGCAAVTRAHRLAVYGCRRRTAEPKSRPDLRAAHAPRPCVRDSQLLLLCRWPLCLRGTSGGRTAPDNQTTNANRIRRLVHICCQATR